MDISTSADIDTSTHGSQVWVVLADPGDGQLVGFYQDFLGCSPVIDVPGSYAEFQGFDGLRLGIFWPQASHRVEFAAATSGAMSLCVEVADLEAAIARVRAAGGQCSGTIFTATHGQETYAYDPAGNRLILHCGRAA
jgi:predicted enzyme related to lactoylglutathione lyase